MSRSPKFQQTPRADVLTENEARTLEAIGRGENPCARIGEENTAITGTRRRIVTGLYSKGFVERVDMPATGRWSEADKARAPVLTDKGRTFIAGRT